MTLTFKVRLKARSRFQLDRKLKKKQQQTQHLLKSTVFLLLVNLHLPDSKGSQNRQPHFPSTSASSPATRAGAATDRHRPEKGHVPDIRQTDPAHSYSITGTSATTTALFESFAPANSS